MRWKRFSLFGLGGTLGLLALALIVRAMLPLWVADGINAQLANMGEYRGRLADVDLHLWRGAYSINDLTIEKASGKAPMPLLQAPRIDLSISWRDLVRGSVVAEVEFLSPRINFIDGDEAADQSGRGVDWRRQLEALVPIQLDEVRVSDGTLAFEAFQTKPPAEMVATDVQAIITNLTNVRGQDGKRVATFEAKARILGQAPLESNASFDPFGEMDSFGFDVKVTGMDLTRLNDMLQAYAKVDVARGNGDFVMELQGEGGKIHGYAKPMLRDLDILNWKQDVEEQKDNPLRLLWETLTGAAASVLKNQSKDQFATRIPISGDLDRPKTHRLDALWSILQNAFVKAYQPQLEGLGRE